MQCVLCHMYSCTYCNTHAHISISGQDCHLRSEVSPTIPISITCTHAALNSLTCTYMHNTIQYYMSLVYKQQPLYTPSDVHNSHLIQSVGICSPLQQ